MKKTILVLLALTLSAPFIKAQEPTMEQTLEFLNYKDNLSYLTPSWEGGEYEKIAYDKENNRIILTRSDGSSYIIPMDFDLQFNNELWANDDDHKLEYGEERKLSIDGMYNILKKSANNFHYRAAFFLESAVVNQDIFPYISADGESRKMRTIAFYNVKPKVSLALLHLMKLANANKNRPKKYDNLKF